MLISIFEMGIMRKLSFLILLLCIYTSLKNQNAKTKKGSSISKWPYSSDPSSIFSAPLSSRSMLLSMMNEIDSPPSLEYDFYRESCPHAEKIIRAIVWHLCKVRFDVAPALLRLVFHDCFIEGCDASVLLDPADGIDSEKESPPNGNLKGFDIIDIIKSELEKVCPGVVSCADIVVLAARDGVVMAGGPFYPLHTGRRDSTLSFSDIATYELPSPHADLPETLASFNSRGFDERETVSLLGAHSIGVIHCKFFENRLYNFGGTDEPDPSLDMDFLNLLRSRCNDSRLSSPSAPTPSFTAFPSAAAAPSPSFTGLPSAAPPPSSPSFTGSPSAAASPSSPSFTGSPSSAVVPSPSLNGLPLSAAVISPSFNCSPLPSFHGSPLSAAVLLPSFKTTLVSSPEEPWMEMDYEARGSNFGTLYYRRLLQGKGILYADQQLMAGEETGNWVRAYASDAYLFRRDFALAMMKLSNLRILTAPMGQIRLNCSKVA